MVRSELVQAIVRGDPGLTLRQVDDAVDAIFDMIAAHLAAGGRVELRTLGSFTTRPRNAWIGRSPKSGASVSIAAKRVPNFKPSKALLARLARNNGDTDKPA